MISWLKRFSIVLFVFFLYSTSFALYSPNQKSSAFAYHPQRLLIKFQPQFKSLKIEKINGQITTGIAELDQLHQKYSVLSQKKLFNPSGLAKKNNLLKPTLDSVSQLDLSNWYIVEFPVGTNLQQSKQEYQKLNQVQYAEFDYRLELFGVPNDSLFDKQWNLHNTGQPYWGILQVDGSFNDSLILKSGAPDADIDAWEAFQRSFQKVTPVIGLLDTGVDSLHPDLQANLWNNSDEIPNNGIDDDHNGFVDDSWGWDFSGDDSLAIIEDNNPTDHFGHGTHLAGIMGAERDNAIGISGVALDCKILPLKIFPNLFYSVASRGIFYAVQNGADIINMSWGGIFPSKLLEEAVQYANSQGVVLVASSGNIDTNQNLILYPASYDEVISVGATNSSDQRSYFSNFGAFLDVVAPGEEILSLRASGTDMYETENEPGVHILAEKYYIADGTSMAAPHVAAIAASLVAASSGLTNQKIKEIIQNSADDLIDPNGVGDSLAGWDQFSGFGRVNLNTALNYISGFLAQITFPQNYAIVSGEIQIIGTASGDSFQTYQLEYGQGLNPQSWNAIDSSNSTVSEDTLGAWNTVGLDGIYSLRLKLTENIFYKIAVLVSNSNIAQITSPLDYDTINTQLEIKGSALAPNFSSYKLEYAAFPDTSFWRLILSSTKPVWDSILGFWTTANISNGLYYIRLTLQTDSTSLTDQTLVYVSNNFLAGWPQQLNAPGSIVPAVEDLDGDGMDEIIVGTSRGVYVYSSDGNIFPGWPQDTSQDFRSACAVADLNSDGRKEVVISSNRALHVYQFDGTRYERWPNLFESGWEFWAYPTPIVADFDSVAFGPKDSLNILLVNHLGNTYAWNYDGASWLNGKQGLWRENPWDLKEPPNWGALIPLIIADLDRDGENEVCLGLGSDILLGGVFIYNYLGRLLYQPSIGNQLSLVSGMAASDVDRDGELEIVAVGADENDEIGVWVINKDGTPASGWPQKLGLSTCCWISGYPALGDLNNDGKLEIVITVFSLDEARVYAWQEDGTPLTALNSPWLAKVEGTLGNPILADVDGDGYVDILARGGWIIPGTGPERIFAWKYTGELLNNWPLHTPASINSVSSSPFTPVIKDINHNGKLDIILVSDDQSLVIWELPTDYDSSLVPWGTFMQNSQRRGILPRFTTDVKTQPRPTIPLNFELNQNYPNPFNSNTAIQYSLPRTSKVMLSVYNILGQKVKTLVDDRQVKGYKTVNWDGTNEAGEKVASGIYFYTLQTEAFSQTKKMVLLK